MIAAFVALCALIPKAAAGAAFARAGRGAAVGAWIELAGGKRQATRRVERSAREVAVQGAEEGSQGAEGHGVEDMHFWR
jgi:hypothetical protein